MRPFPCGGWCVKYSVCLTLEGLSQQPQTTGPSEASPMFIGFISPIWHEGTLLRHLDASSLGPPSPISIMKTCNGSAWCSWVLLEYIMTKCRGADMAGGKTGNVYLCPCREGQERMGIKTFSGSIEAHQVPGLCGFAPVKIPPLQSCCDSPHHLLTL